MSGNPPLKNVSVSDPEVYKELLLAYVKDVREPPTEDVQKRFRDIVEKGFKDNKEISLQSQRIGVNMAVAVSTLYVRSYLTKIDFYENVIRDHGAEVTKIPDAQAPVQPKPAN